MPRRPTRRLAAVLMLAAPLAACGGGRQAAQTPAAAPQQCFESSQITSFQAVDRETVLLRVGASQLYELKITGVCPDIDWSQSIGIQGETGSTICTGQDVTLVTPSPRGGTQECYANEIRMAPAQAAPR